MAAAGSSPATAREPTLADLMDPVALERRLEVARRRRAIVLARPAAPAPPPAPRAAFAAVARRTAEFASGRTVAGFALGVAAGAALAAMLLPWRPPEPPDAWHAIAPAAGPAEPARMALAAPSEPVLAASRPAALVPPGVVEAAALRPQPRPEGPLRLTRSARNGPPGAPRPTVGQVVGGLNAATLGQAAAALGVRQRIALPGLTIVLDRRGLRLRPAKTQRRVRRN